MKKIFTFAAALLTALISYAATPVAYPTQTVHYDVSYRWGFINKTAAHGVVRTACSSSGHFTGSLYGQSIPWDGRLYTVVDTLSAVMATPGASGVSAEKVLLRNGRYSKPQVGESTDLNNPSAYWDTDGSGLLNASAGTKEAVTITSDMLSLFYYAKALDFDSMTAGGKVNVPISYPNGTHGSLAITYGGEQTVNVGAVEVPCYSIVFNYTYNGSPSAYPVNCWISKDGRIPVIISASLEIGHMEMIARL